MGISKLRVHTDSDFLRRSVTDYMPKWRENGYVKSDGNRVVNREDFQGLDRAIRGNPHMEVEFKHVPAHSGHPYNDEADRLAKEGAKRYGQ